MWISIFLIGVIIAQWYQLQCCNARAKAAELEWMEYFKEQAAEISPETQQQQHLTSHPGRCHLVTMSMNSESGSMITMHK